MTVDLIKRCDRLKNMQIDRRQPRDVPLPADEQLHASFFTARIAERRCGQTLLRASVRLILIIEVLDERVSYGMVATTKIDLKASLRNMLSGRVMRACVRQHRIFLSNYTCSKFPTRAEVEYRETGASTNTKLAHAIFAK